MSPQPKRASCLSLTGEIIVRMNPYLAGWALKVALFTPDKEHKLRQHRYFQFLALNKSRNNENATESAGLPHYTTMMELVVP